MRNLLCSSLALALTACATESSPMPDPIDDPPVMETPAIQLSLGADSARVIRGRSVQVAVSVKRTGDIAGAITVTAEDLPAGVTAAPLTLAEGQTSGTLELAGDASMTLASFATATIRATAGDLESALPLDLHLTDPSGSLDVTFGIGGGSVRGYTSAHQEVATLLAMQTDGKIVVGGRDDTANGFFVARYHADGALDTSFGSGGVVAISDGNVSIYAVGLAITPDGTILFGVKSASNAIIYALDTNGQLATSYGQGGVAMLSAATLGITFPLYAMTAAADGTLVLGSTNASGVNVVRLTPDGQLDSSFDEDGRAVLAFRSTNNTVTSLAIRPDGRIVVAGADNQGGYNSFAIGQLTTSGQLDPTFSADGVMVLDAGSSTGFEDLTLLPDGRIALRTYRQGSLPGIAFVKPDGQLDTSFSGDGFAQLRLSSAGQVVVVDDGIIVVGSPPGTDAAALEKLGFDGTPAATFGTDGLSLADMTAGDEYGHGLVRDGQGRVVMSSYSIAGAELGQIALARFWE